MINEKLFYPILSSILPNYQVSIAPNHTAGLVIAQKPDSSIENSKLSIVKSWIALPFGGMYIIPLVLLVFQKNWKLAKQLTFYHLLLTLMPIVLLMISFKVFNIIPQSIFQNLNIVLGFVFLIIAYKGVRNID